MEDFQEQIVAVTAQLPTHQEESIKVSMLAVVTEISLDQDASQ